MEITELLNELAQMGTDQNIKIYGRHGVQPPLFGVSYGNLNALKKRIKINHPLALELWATGNHDARILATMIADPKQASEALLDGWVGDVHNYSLSDALSVYIGKITTDLARVFAERWLNHPGEWPSATAWNTIGQLIKTTETIGEVYIDHGQTGCVTPDPIPYMERTINHRAKKQASA